MPTVFLKILPRSHGLGWLFFISLIHSFMLNKKGDPRNFNTRNQINQMKKIQWRWPQWKTKSQFCRPAPIEYVHVHHTCTWPKGFIPSENLRQISLKLGIPSPETFLFRSLISICFQV